MTLTSGLSRCTLLINSIPSISGMMRSAITRSTEPDRRCSRAALPVSHTATVYPSCSRSSLRTSLTTSLSSATRIERVIGSNVTFNTHITDTIIAQFVGISISLQTCYRRACELGNPLSVGHSIRESSRLSLVISEEPGLSRQIVRAWFD